MHASAHVPPRHRQSLGQKTLIGLLLFNGVGAVFGGIGLLTDSIGMPGSLLDGTPFDSYLIPGLILLFIVAGSSLLASGMLLASARYAELAAVFAGAVVLGWIVVQFIIIPAGWSLQIVFLIIALAVIGLGLAELQKRR